MRGIKVGSQELTFFNKTNRSKAILDLTKVLFSGMIVG